MPKHCLVADIIAEAADPSSPKPPGGCVLVVGTTPDYVARIHAGHPQSAFFLTRDVFRNHPQLTKIPASRLLYDPLDDDRASLAAVCRWMARAALTLTGVACFDCEALMTAGRIARSLNLPFAELPAIERSRNKFETKRCWSNAGIRTPAGTVASGLEETLAFLHGKADGIVLKPLSASGSELAFHCTTPAQVRTAVRTLQEQLPRRRHNPLFQPIASLAGNALALDPCGAWVVESYVPGPEFSCDFFLKNHQVKLIRSTGKVKSESHPFGSMLAYTFPPRFPDGFSIDGLATACLRAATALGFTRGHFMMDYIVCNGLIVLLELTPRPGGDCIPDLIAAATGIDLIGLHLDWARGVERVPDFSRIAPESFASINFYAPSPGIITHLDAGWLKARPEVLQVVLNKQVGDTVLLPPADYDNRLLGYGIVATAAGRDLSALADELNGALKVAIRPMPPHRKRP